jgi:hypothetical protein
MKLSRGFVAFIQALASLRLPPAPRICPAASRSGILIAMATGAVPFTSRADGASAGRARSTWVRSRYGHLAWPSHYSLAETGRPNPRLQRTRLRAPLSRKSAQDGTRKNVLISGKHVLSGPCPARGGWPGDQPWPTVAQRQLEIVGTALLLAAFPFSQICASAAVGLSVASAAAAASGRTCHLAGSRCGSQPGVAMGPPVTMR